MIFLDFETYSDVDLLKAGPYVYTESPYFTPLMMSYAIQNGPVKRVEDVAEMREIIEAARLQCRQFIAHNAQFERLVCSRILGMPVGEYLSPSMFEDTAALASALGYPRALGPLAKALGVEAKDTAGTRLINLFCKPRPRVGGRLLPHERPEEWARFGEYCDQDVKVLQAVWRELARQYPTGGEELAIFMIDQQINDRGIAVDLDLAREAVRAGADNAFQLEIDLCELTGVANPASTQQMSAWLAQQGVTVTDLRADTVREMLAGELPERVRTALEMRQELALAAGKKFSAAQRATSSDGRARGMFQYCGAHTGRWAGRRIQLQNLPRFKHEKDHEGELIADLLLGGDVANSDLKGIVRAMLLGPFTVVDYSAIEARVLAWLAGEQWVLDAFKQGRDIYTETAKRLGSKPDGEGYSRQEGKTATLALGYQGALGSMLAMGATGSESELLALVSRWREANPRIVALWRELEARFWSGGDVGELLHVTRSGRDRLIRLPSGRELVYHGVAKRRVRKKRDDGTTYERDELSFIAPLPNAPRTPTYGGRLAENITQAVARDVLAHALVRLESAGYRVVGHVHDEVLIEGVHDVADVARVMCADVGWNAGLPLGAEGYVTERYRKE